MYSPNIIIYSIAFLALISSFVGFYALSLRNEEFSPYKNIPFFIFFPVIGLSFIALFLLLPHQTDFIYPSDFKPTILLLVGGSIVYCCFKFLNSSILRIFITLICSIIICILTPSDFILVPQLSPIWSKIILSACLFLFTYFYSITNNIDTLTCIQTLSINMGIYILALCGGVPLLLGAYGLSFAAVCLSFLVFNRYPAKLSFTNAGCNALGFMTGCLVLYSIIEGSSIAIFIFTIFFWIELFSSFFKKILDWQNNFALNTYTNCYQANLSGFPPYTIAGHILRLQIILLLLGCFAIYTPENITIPIFSIIITSWYISKIKNWQTGNKTIRELNNDLMNNIKNNINIIKEQINKDK